jgi:recombination protein RecA
MSLEKALAYINSNIKDCAVRPLSKFPNMRVQAIDSRSLILNSVIGRGGWPRGHMVEIYGGEGVGKTTICYHAIAEAQSKGITAAMIDAEHRVDVEYAKSLGVNPDELLFYQPESGEKGMEAADAILRSNEVGLLIIDSIDAIRPKAEEEGDFGNANVGRHAKLINEVCRDFTPIKGECCIIFTNQIRENPGKMFGNPEYTPGGRAMKFYASIRLELRKGETQTDDDEQAVSNIVKLKCVKNSIAPPFKRAEITLVYGKGIDIITDTFEAALLSGVLTKRGSNYQLHHHGKETSIGKGKAFVHTWLAENGRAEKLRAIIKQSDWFKRTTGEITTPEPAKQREDDEVPSDGEEDEEGESMGGLSVL